MNRLEQSHGPELASLIEQARNIPHLPAATRARVLTRAREAMGNAATANQPQATSTKHRRLLLALAASISLCVIATGAVAAFRAWSGHSTTNAASPAPLPPRPAASVIVDEELPPPVPEVDVPTPVVEKLHRATRPTPAQVSYAAELGLLQRAQAAYAEQNYGFALSMLSTHARRFPKGLLQEEREALRVRSLAGAGRNEEAKRAAAAFAARFPRSVLLPRLSGDSR